MWQALQGVPWQGIVDGATVLGLVVGSISLYKTREQVKKTHSAADAAKDAARDTARAVAGRSAELQLTICIRDMRHQLAHLERACATGNHEVAQLALGHWRNSVVEALAICRHLVPNFKGRADVSRGTTAANIAGQALAIDTTAVQEALGQALEPMTKALDALQASAAEARSQPSSPQAGNL